VPNPMTSQAVPLAEHRALLADFGHAAALLDAIELFSPMNLAALVARIDHIVDEIDSRLGLLEYRLDEADIKGPEAGIPDEDAGRYFTLPSIRGCP
jgi:hypothetical protein